MDIWSCYAINIRTRFSLRHWLFFRTTSGIVYIFEYCEINRILTVISGHWKLPHGGNFRQHQHHGRYKGVSYGKRGKQEKGESSKKGNKESKGGLINGGGDCQQGREGEEEGEELNQENKSKEEEKGIQERRKRERRKEGGRKTKLAG